MFRASKQYTGKDRLSVSENLLSDEPRRLAADASYDLAFPGSFTYSRARAERRVNEFKYLHTPRSEGEGEGGGESVPRMNETRFISHGERDCGGRFPKESSCLA